VYFPTVSTVPETNEAAIILQFLTGGITGAGVVLLVLEQEIKEIRKITEK
jgi:hypothetical protein